MDIADKLKALGNDAYKQVRRVCGWGGGQQQGNLCQDICTGCVTDTEQHQTSRECD
jgi:hypothetical protein